MIGYKTGFLHQSSDWLKKVVSEMTDDASGGMLNHTVPMVLHPLQFGAGK